METFIKSGKDFYRLKMNPRVIAQSVVATISVEDLANFEIKVSDRTNNIKDNSSKFEFDNDCYTDSLVCSPRKKDNDFRLLYNHLLNEKDTSKSYYLEWIPNGLGLKENDEIEIGELHSKQVTACEEMEESIRIKNVIVTARRRRLANDRTYPCFIYTGDGNNLE